MVRAWSAVQEPDSIACNIPPSRSAVRRGALEGTMNRNDAYTFLMLGRNVERADMTSRIVDVQLLNAAHEPCRVFTPGEVLIVRVRAEFLRSVPDPVVGVLIRNRIGIDVFGTNTRLEQADLGPMDAGDTIEVDFEVDCLLSRQEYTLTVATQYSNGLSQDWLDDVLDFRVVDTKDVAGVLNLNARVRSRKGRAVTDREGSGVGRS